MLAVTEDEHETLVCQSFLRDGYYQFKIENIDRLDCFRLRLYHGVLSYLNIDDNCTPENLFNNIMQHVSSDKLNDFRLYLIHLMESTPEVRQELYQLSKKYLDWIVGNEIAMQRNSNISIQLPNDDSSLLGLHTDVWSGNSPYEVVFWLPLVNCYNTKSMYIISRKDSDEILNNFKKYAHYSSDELYDVLKTKAIWVKIPYGHGLIFSHGILHGNITNTTSEARWSINVRFKSLLSPYGSKPLGESFLPLIVRPSTSIGMNYPEAKCQ